MLQYDFSGFHCFPENLSMIPEILIKLAKDSGNVKRFQSKKNSIKNPKNPLSIFIFEIFFSHSTKLSN